MNCKITNNSDMNIDQLSPLIDDLASHIQDVMKIKSMPAVTLQEDADNADVLLGKTAYYDPQNKVVTVYVTNRHPKDIMRSISHEFIHHAQNERGEFENVGSMGEGYAQANEHLRNMEKEAYLKGNMCFRDWEDGYKRSMMESIHRQNSFKRRNKTMKIHKWKNNELNKLLMEKFNFGGKKKYDLEEGVDRIFAPNHYCAHHVVHEGQEAYTVDHNWDEELQEVTEYDIRFRDGTVKRNVSINELEVLEAFSEANHGNRDEHPGAKAKKKDEEDEEKSVNEDMGKAEEELKAKIKQAEDDGDKKKAEELRKQLQQMGGTMEEAAKPDFIDLDGDGDKEESMKKAAADKKAGKKGKEDDEKEKQEESFRDSVRDLMERIINLK
tara:strand:+ start:5890 stop:7035 length:1146 start_codon:yes stop_codon:yes gene_type:complete